MQQKKNFSTFTFLPAPRPPAIPPQKVFSRATAAIHRHRGGDHMTRLAACTFGIILPLLLIVTFGAVEAGKTRAAEVLLFQRFDAAQAMTYMWDFHTRLLIRSPQYRILYSNPSPSPDGRWLVYSSYRGGQSDILLRDFSTQTVSRLTFSLSDDHSPVWSEDGKWVAFTSNRDGNYEIYLVEVQDDGTAGEYIRVTHHPGADLSPVWSFR